MSNIFRFYFWRGEILLQQWRLILFSYFTHIPGFKSSSCLLCIVDPFLKRNLRTDIKKCLAFFHFERF